jgi:hypothetical protein
VDEFLPDACLAEAGGVLLFGVAFLAACRGVRDGAVYQALLASRRQTSTAAWSARRAAVGLVAVVVIYSRRVRPRCFSGLELRAAGTLAIIFAGQDRGAQGEWVLPATGSAHDPRRWGVSDGRDEHRAGALIVLRVNCRGGRQAGAAPAGPPRGRRRGRRSRSALGCSSPVNRIRVGIEAQPSLRHLRAPARAPQIPTQVELCPRQGNNPKQVEDDRSGSRSPRVASARRVPATGPSPNPSAQERVRLSIDVLRAHRARRAPFCSAISDAIWRPRPSS